MKVRNPRSRFDLSVKKNDYVLEVGCGHDPHKKANVVVDKFLDTNYHRSGDIKVMNHQRFFQADGENLPFDDKQFDYAITTHVIEHVDNPDKFLEEQFRCAKAGYVEAPSLIGEHLIPKESHKWALLEIDNKIVIMDKKEIGFNTSHDFGNLFLDFMPRKSLGYKILQRTYGDLLTIRYEWKDDIEFLVNPTDNYYKQFFIETWKEEMYNAIFPQRSLGSELAQSASAFGDILKSVFKSKVLKKSAV